MKHIILANPVSGNKRGIKIATRVKIILNKYNIDCDIYVSHKIGELNSLANELAAKSQCRFYVIGGDGSLNEVVSGIIGTDSEIVVIPCGTGNDFSRYINKYKSLRKIIIESINTNSKKYDVIKLHDGRYCFNILNIGFDAIVAQNMNKFRKVPISGSAKYGMAIIYTLFQNKNFNLKIRTNNFVQKAKFTLVAISNARFYGGGIVPNPHSTPNDGKLSICTILATSIIKKIILLPKYKKTEHEHFKIVKMDDTITEFSIVSNEPFPLSIDGEISFTNKLKGNIIPSCVNVVQIEKE